MQKYDAHIHMFTKDPSAEALLAALEKAGFYGAAVFSQPPPLYDDTGIPAEERLQNLLALTAPSAGRLLPVLWLHPHEADTAALIKEAAARGIRGFKIICNTFHVYEDASMEVLHAVAAAGLPVQFHSGILWDRTPSSQFNRPLDFEALVTVPKLRFALAHCAWPWVDECLALYGKFLTVGQAPGSPGAEMYFDLTPGTPALYRRDLLTKLHRIGYDTTHNLLFGTDCTAHDYNDAWTREWAQRDDAIYDELGVGDDTRRRIYQQNFLRFFGLSAESHTPQRLSMDGR